MKVKFKVIPTKSGKTAPVPEYKSEFSAGADLCACIDEPITVLPHGRALVPTGFAIEPGDERYAGFVFARSGLSSKNGICMANGVGVVDYDYRGELKVPVLNSSDTEYTIMPFERIAQLVFLPVEVAQFVKSDVLNETKRGDGGFGSTGK